MDLYPLFNSLRIALISTSIVFFAGVFVAYYTSMVPAFLKGVLDTVFTLPLVLPPTVVGFMLLKIFGPKSYIGALFLDLFDFRFTMNWWSAVIATSVVIFPLMYRTARGAFQTFDRNLSDVGRTLGLSNSYIFWKIIMPNCNQGIIAGVVLSFARALGEYGATSMVAGYTPGKTATISTTVYQLWSTNNDVLAFKWVVLNILISIIVLYVISYIENSNHLKEAKHVSNS
ncbi:MAG: molybdate ABC transporter permease subunit [Ruminococcaceae bacterium]|nr:molybdate ABC transporter permease subunit [Oscillospiraceae bacterium]